MSELRAQFEVATEEVQQLPYKPDNETLLKLYGLFKQATVGNVKGKRPGFTNPVGRAKFDAWKRLRGKKQEQAMEEYIALVERLKKKA